MRDSLESLAAVAAERLGDEHFEDACPFAARGFISLYARRASRAMSGNLWLTVNGSTVENAVEDEKLPDNMILALTPTRLFIFELDTKIARAGELKVILPLGSVADVASRQSRSFPMIKRLDLDIALVDGNQLELEIGSPAVKDGERFVGALAAAVGSCAS